MRGPLPAGGIPDRHHPAEVARDPQHPRRRHPPGRPEDRGLPGGVLEVVRGAGGERDRRGDHGRRSRRRAGDEVCGDEK